MQEDNKVLSALESHYDYLIEDEIIRERKEVQIKWMTRKRYKWDLDCSKTSQEWYETLIGLEPF